MTVPGAVSLYRLILYRLILSLSVFVSIFHDVKQNQVTEESPLEKISDVHLLISLLGIITVSTLSTESILRAKP